MNEQLNSELGVLEEVQKGIRLARYMELCNTSSEDSEKNLYTEGVLSIHKKIDEHVSIMYWSMLEMQIEGLDNFQIAEENALLAIQNLCTLVSYLRGEVQGQDRSKDIFNSTRTKAFPKNYREILDKVDTITPKPSSVNIIQQVISNEKDFDFFRHFNGA